MKDDQIDKILGIKSPVDNDDDDAKSIMTVHDDDDDNSNQMYPSPPPRNPRKLPARNSDPITEAEDDMEYVRGNMYELIESGNLTIERMMDIANSSQHPRSYEVLSAMIKQMMEANEKLLDIHKKRKAITSTPGQGGGKAGVTNNNLFVGSTDKLLKFLEKENNGGE